MRYSIVFKPSAKREFHKLDRPLKIRVQRELERLAQDPLHPGTKQLKEVDGARRARVGDYRIVYKVIDEQVVVLVLRIAHRREVYRSL